MRQLFLLIILILIKIFSFCQNNISTTGIKSIFSENKRWNLEKYVWSHTKYKNYPKDKAVLDFDAIESWKSLGNDRDLSISPDGKYFAYSLMNNHLDKLPDSIIVQSVQGNWRQVISGAKPGFFSRDSRLYAFQAKEGLIFLKTGGTFTDTLKKVNKYKLPENEDHKWVACLIKNSNTLVVKNLITDTEKRFNNVSDFSFDKSGSWLTCQVKNENNDLFLYQLSTGEELIFPWVIEYMLNESGEALIMKTKEKLTDNTTTTLKWIELSKKSEKAIWSTTDTSLQIGNYCLDERVSQVVFMVTDKESCNSIWYYHVGMDKAILKVNNRTPGVDTGLLIQGKPSFTENGHYIMFSLQWARDVRQSDPYSTSVDVWSYRDTLLRTTQASLSSEPRKYQAVIQTDGANVIRLEAEYETLKTVNIPGDFAVIGKNSDLVYGDLFWLRNYDNYDINWVVSLKDGSRKLLPLRNYSNQGSNLWFSPTGRYLVFFDAKQQYNYFSYDLVTNKLVNISLKVPRHQLGYEDYNHLPKGKKNFLGLVNYGIAAWLGESGVLVYDDYDIWQLDLSAKKEPINITNSFGHTHQVILSFIQNDRFRSEKAIMLSVTDTLLLKAFDRQNKNNGFYRKLLTNSGDPELLYMGPYFFQTQSMLDIPGFSNRGIMIKALGSDTWILKRQSATDAPNYFMTNDFRKFIRLTNIQPHKAYNWLTSELHKFRQKDGTLSQGVLYKPENFNPNKKYPVIVSFYFQNSDQLNLYPVPELLAGPFDYCNPAWFVSHGYLIFCPDIYFRDTAWGPSVLNTLDGAARYLSALSYVDGKSIGLSGHSNSGRMGYYALTHSRSFAAMSIGSGAYGPDFMSSAFSFENYLSPGRSMLPFAEEGIIGLGSLWKNKAAWLDHTAVLQADKVVSPLLLFFNDQDVDPVSRGAELFMALRRLGKKVWWLNYNQEGHTLKIKNAQKDYTIRYTQFFDHYLKRAPAPRWMCEGIPYRLKGIEDRFELNQNDNCGNGCPVCGTKK